MTDVELISRNVLFGNPDISQVRISPDGETLSYLAPYEGVLNIYVAPVSEPQERRPLTRKTGRGIIAHYWSYSGEHVFYPEDDDGNENYHLHCVEVATGDDRDLTPFDEVRVQLQQLSPERPDEMLVLMNDRDPELHDIYHLDVSTGDLEKILENDQNFNDFITDREFQVRFGKRMKSDGSVELLRRTEDDSWEEFQTIGCEDEMTTGPLGLNRGGDLLYMEDSRDRDTSALVAFDIESGERKVLAEHPDADLSTVLTDPREKKPLAVAFYYDRKKWNILDDSVRDDFEQLRSLEDGDIIVADQSYDNNTWVVAYNRDDGSPLYYCLDREEQEAKFLFSTREELDDKPLTSLYPEIIRSRDGLDLVSYLQLPPGVSYEDGDVPGEPLPMVLKVHGGPWSRDSWGYNSASQWLANRGYAVLSVNFRGSTGFGKSFINAGDGEWAARMHDDLLDGVDWAVEEGIADPDRVAIFGGSYGGYAALVGLTFTPDVFACGVCLAGPSNLITLIQHIPPYWAPILPMLTQRVGADPSTEEGRETLMECSPISRVDQIKKPLLMGYGANDPRVKKMEAEQFVDALEKKNIPVTYVQFPDEGHGFVRPENRMAMYAVAEAFLSEHLGGRFEPVEDDLDPSSIEFKTGRDCIPGLD